MDKRQQTIFLAAILIVGALAAFLFFSGQKERKARQQKEMELSVKLTELSQKNAEISNLIKQKKELEEQFESKVSELETALKNQAEAADSLHVEIDRLAQEKEALQNANASHEKEISEMKKQIENFETDRMDLLSVIKQLKKDLSEAQSSQEKAKTAALARPNLMMDAATGSVDLGQIVMRKSSGSAARVEKVDKLYHFILVNAGQRDGLRKGMVLNVLREDRPIAKVVVQKTTNNAAAAVMVPEWTKEDIQVGDTISVVPNPTT